MGSGLTIIIEERDIGNIIASSVKTSTQYSVDVKKQIKL